MPPVDQFRPTRTVRQAVILAGGLATRMLPRTERVPKLLLPVAGRPFARWLLERLVTAGFDEAVLCIGHLGEAIVAELGERFGPLRLRHSNEGVARLGTGGALRLALPWLAPTFLVTYGDSYLPFDYAAPLADLEAHPEALGTMAVYRNDDQGDLSNTALSGELVARYAKRKPGDARPPELTYIDYGALALRRAVVEALPEGPSDLSAVQARLARDGTLRALVATRRFFEIGSESGLLDLERELAPR